MKEKEEMNRATLFKYYILKTIHWILIINFSLISCDGNETDNYNSNRKNEKNAQEYVIVKTSESFTGNLIKYVNAEGRAQAVRKYPVIFEKSDYIEELRVREGQYLKKDSLIARLRNDKEFIAIQENHALLIKSISEFASKMPGDDSTHLFLKNHLHNNSLNTQTIPLEYKDNSIDSLIRTVLSGKDRTEVMMATSGLSQAYTAYNKALLNYNRTFFYAPFSGFIGNILAKEGEYINAGIPLLVLYDLSKIKLNVELLESEVPFFKPGLACKVEFNAIPGKIFDGKIYEINPVIDMETHTQSIGIILNNGYRGIYPGMSARVRISISTEHKSLLVPKEAILERDGRFLVFVVRDSIANWCYITPGQSNDKYTQILSSEFNLKSGEQVITEGHFSLAHGAKVTINE
jgi:multidrug efflux pump subunit AcrA (membrane-fusion protein)